MTDGYYPKQKREEHPEAFPEVEPSEIEVVEVTAPPEVVDEGFAVSGQTLMSLASNILAGGALHDYPPVEGGSWDIGVDIGDSAGDHTQVYSVSHSNGLFIVDVPALTPEPATGKAMFKSFFKNILGKKKL